MPVLGTIQFPKRLFRVGCGLIAVFMGIVKNKLILSYTVDHLVPGQSCLISHRTKWCHSQDEKTLCSTAGGLCCFPSDLFHLDKECAESQELLTCCVYMWGQPCLDITSVPSSQGIVLQSQSWDAVRLEVRLHGGILSTLHVFIQPSK